MTALPKPLHPALDADRAHAHGNAHALSFWKKYVFSTDHKIIGIQFLFLGLLFMVAGGSLAMLVRWQLAYPGDKGHPVPILGRYLWLSYEPDAPLGSALADDAKEGTFTIVPERDDWSHIAEDVKPGDLLKVVPASQSNKVPVVPLKVASVETSGWQRITAQVDTSDESNAAKLKAGELRLPRSDDHVTGRRMPGVMNQDFYTMAFSMHATIMIFFVIIPLLVGTFGNYLIPLKIGAADMAFPFLNGVAFWSAVPAGAIIIAGFFVSGGHSGAGWTVYPPLSSIQQNKGYVDYEGPRTGWESFVSTLRFKTTGAAVDAAADPSTFDNGTLTQRFRGDSAKVSAGIEKALRELADEDAAKPVKPGTAAPPLAGLKMDSASASQVIATLATGQKLTAIVTRDDAATGTFALRVGDKGDEDLARRIDARTARKLTEFKSGQSSWSTASILMAYFAWFMFFLYLFAYHVRIVPAERSYAAPLFRTLVGPLLFVGSLAALVLPGLLGHGYASTAGGNSAFVLLVLLCIEGLILTFGAGLNQHLAVALALIAGFYLTKWTQTIAFDGQTCWFFSIIILGFSSIMGAVNYLATVVKLRCPGMTMFRLPLSVWSIFITAILVLLATPVLASVLTMNLLDHHRLTSFFLPYDWNLQNQMSGGFNDAAVSAGVSGGGYALLHQHLFWFYSHPAVYIMILPAMGMVSDILATFARKPVYGYRPMVYAMAGIAFLGFIVWAHHMFQSGMNPTLGTTFALSTMVIAVPSAIKVFNWLGTIWGGNIRFTAAMWGAIFFVSTFVVGGLSGIYMAAPAVDVQIHDTYFIVAHIHYVLFGGSIFGVFAAIYFWYPKMFGRMMNNKVGSAHMILTFIFFNLTFFPMHFMGIRGMPRRVADPFSNYSTFADLLPMNKFVTHAAFAMGMTQLLLVVNFIGAWIWGRKAPNNPWQATTLEWNDTTSPPPHGNFATTPIVHHGPYEYSTPLVAEDWLAQTRPVDVSPDQLAAGH